ncbi:MAG TPA: DUF167 domain-containing protein [Polyangiaceae bacterium]|nr:DUF167 domain-containing protein [Polyangiaceae bacterium]
MRVTVRVKPKARHTRILRAEGLSIEASLAAQPVDGAANAELLELLARSLSLPKSCLELTLGQTSKQKVVEIAGLDAAEVVSRLAKAAG